MSLHVAVSGWLLGPPSGANRRLLGLLAAMRGLLQEGERVTVLHPRGYEPPFAGDGILWRPVAIPAAPTWARVRAERRILPGLLRELGTDVLDHGLLPAPRVPCRLCLLIHDVRDADGEGTRWRWLARAVLRSSLARAAAVVVPSRFTRARIEHHVGHTPPIHVIANAASLMQGATPRGGTLSFLHVGHLEPRKNLILLLRAFSVLPVEVRKRHPLRLCGADHGSGPELRQLAQEHGLGQQVEFTGLLPDAELSELYASAIVCVPSRYEGSGLCALEGLAAGRQVLVSDRGALPELDGVRVLPADDPAAWAAAMAAAAAAPTHAGTIQPAADPWQASAMALLELWRALRR